MPLPDELKQLAKRVSNWGRWGDDDQRGTHVRWGLGFDFQRTQALYDLAALVQNRV